MGRYLVTGANRGIGLEFCRQLVGRGDDVIATCRMSNAELGGLGVRVEQRVDLASDSVEQLAQRLEGIRLDVLINNAGIMEPTGLDTLDLDSIRRQFEINAVGTLRVTKAMLGNLREGSKVAIITSLMGSMTDNTSGGSYGYRMSKAAVNAAGVSLSHDLAPRKISVAILHPGMVQTDMTGHSGITPKQSVSGLLELIDGMNLDNSGTFWHTDGRVLPW